MTGKTMTMNLETSEVAIMVVGKFNLNLYVYKYNMFNKLRNLGLEVCLEEEVFPQCPQ